MTASAWTAGDLPDLSGRTVVVTGASSGIGAATARALAAAGAHVVLAVRDPVKGDRVAEGIDGDTEVRPLDLADLTSVRAFARDWSRPLDILINNAGIMAVAEGRTVDGFELHIGTNHLGHFALTTLLLPHLRDRVVTVSSLAAARGRIDLDDLNWERRRYRPWQAYCQSKLANLLFTHELNLRLGEDGGSVVALSAHPGFAATPLQRRTGSRIQNHVLAPFTRAFAQGAEQGALPTLFAATQEVPGGAYIGPDGNSRMRRSPVLVPPPAAATDSGLAHALWDVSADLTGLNADRSGANLS
jgi:NAD(P)-dependent dehydrogenase (short-subunit alcohol dehydrogenase family)